MLFKKGEIEGVFIKPLVRYLDERGSTIEAIRIDLLDCSLDLVMSYVSFTKSGVKRGPHEHIFQKDIFIFIGPGNFEIKLWDNRRNRKSYGHYTQLLAGEDNPVRIIVPPGVVHAYRNISRKNGMVINYPDKLYRGWGKKEKVDEIRHEDKKDAFFLDFNTND